MVEGGGLMKQPPTRKKTAKIVGIIVAVLLLLAIIICVVISIYVGYSMTHPEKKPIDQLPSDYGMEYDEIGFSSKEDGLNLAGWVQIGRASCRERVWSARGDGGVTKKER